MPKTMEKSAESKVLLVSSMDWALFNFHLPIARALRDSGRECVLVCPKGDYTERLRKEGFRLICWRLSRGSINPITELLAITHLTRIYREESPDAVHHFTIKPNLYGTIAARLSGVPIILNNWEGLGFVFTSSFRARMLRTFLLPLMRIVFRTSRAWAVFLNREDTRHMRRLKVINPERVLLVSGTGVGVDTERFAPADGRRDEPAVVLMAARLLWDKGVGEFVEAARLLRSRGVAARFRLSGAPDKGNPHFIPEAVLQEWSAEGVVEILGHRDDMPDVLREAHIAVLPSYYPEGVPRSLQEAAATGLPIVATDIEGCRSVVEHGKNGFLVPIKDATALADSIQRLIEDTDLSASFGQASRRIAVEQFSEARAVLQFLEIYRQTGILK